MPNPRRHYGRLALVGAALLGTGCASGTLIANYTISGMDPFYADAGIGAPPALDDAGAYPPADVSGPNPFRPAAFSPSFDENDPFAETLGSALAG